MERDEALRRCRRLVEWYGEDENPDHDVRAVGVVLAALAAAEAERDAAINLALVLLSPGLHPGSTTDNAVNMVCHNTGIDRGHIRKVLNQAAPPTGGEKGWE